MKNIFTLFIAFIVLGLGQVTHSQICNASGNVVIFSNYDGGTLNINVDVNIPNLKIGVVSYEAVAINISGPFAGNVVEVNYSGYNNSPNTNCSPSIATTSISGAGAATTAIELYPAATYTDVDGYPYIICSYQCATGNNGGCNSPFQISEYYVTKFSGALYKHQTQYGCWSGTQSISTTGNCCLMPALPPIANFSVVSDTICINECIAFTDLSANTPDTWSWTAVGASPAASPSQNPTLCFNTAGNYTVNLVATNSAGSDSHDMQIVVMEVDNSVTVTGFTLNANAVAATYQWLDCNNGYSIISGETSSSFSPTTDGSYAVSVSEFGCTDTSACFAILGLGIAEQKSSNVVSFFPNPTSGLITVDATQCNWDGATIKVTSISGQVLMSNNLNSAITTLNLSEFTAGLYLISIETENGIILQKISLK